MAPGSRVGELTFKDLTTKLPNLNNASSHPGRLAGQGDHRELDGSQTGHPTWQSTARPTSIRPK